MTNNAFAKIIDDLRTPLTSVWSLSEILHDYPNLNGEKRQEFLDIIIREAKKMTGIINGTESPVQSTSDTFAHAQSDNLKF